MPVRNLAGSIRALGAPIPETASESMRHRFEAELLESFEIVMSDNLPSADTREHQAIFIAKLSCFPQHFEGRLDRGTRCSRFAFIRSPGPVHVAA